MVCKPHSLLLRDRVLLQSTLPPFRHYSSFNFNFEIYQNWNVERSLSRSNVQVALQLPRVRRLSRLPDEGSLDTFTAFGFVITSITRQLLLPQKRLPSARLAMAVQLARSAPVLVEREELAVEGRRIRSTEEMTSLEACCQVQLFEHPGAVRPCPAGVNTGKLFSLNFEILFS